MKFLKNFQNIFLIFGAYMLLVGMIYWVESGAKDANINSFFDVIWYSLVTLTTVGYGDLMARPVTIIKPTFIPPLTS